MGMRVGAVLAACLLVGCAGNQGVSSGAGKSQQPVPAPDERPAEPTEEPPGLEGLGGVIGFWGMIGTSGDDLSDEVPGWHRHEASGTCLPRGTPGFQLVDEREYAADDESVSLWNEAIATKLTLYVYPAKRPVRVEFDDVVDALQHTCGGRPALGSDVGDARYPQRGHIAACSHELEPGLLLVEQALLFRDGPWHHKVRATFPAAVTSAAYGAAMDVFQTSFQPCVAGVEAVPGRMASAPRAPRAGGLDGGRGLGDTRGEHLAALFRHQHVVLDADAPDIAMASERLGVDGFLQ